jgi:hypothetical protein
LDFRRASQESALRSEKLNCLLIRPVISRLFRRIFFPEKVEKSLGCSGFLFSERNLQESLFLKTGDVNFSLFLDEINPDSCEFSKTPELQYRHSVPDLYDRNSLRDPRSFGRHRFETLDHLKA